MGSGFMSSCESRGCGSRVLPRRASRVPGAARYWLYCRYLLGERICSRRKTHLAPEFFRSETQCNRQQGPNFEPSLAHQLMQ